MKVSVLVPVYNVQDFLPKCIDSILGQTFKEFELILVDDGSTDSSGRICDESAMKDDRIKVFHQTNQGIGATREFALQQSSGEYVMWVDSDDWIRTDAIELLYNRAKEDNADVVRYWLEILYKDSSTIINPKYDGKISLLRDTIASQWASLCLTFTRKGLIEDCRLHFPENINNGEDYYFVNVILLRSNKIAFLNEVLYFYNRLNPLSTIATPSMAKTYEQIESTRLIAAELKEFGFSEIYKSELIFRKYVAKEGLMEINFWRWLIIFPESNYIWVKALLGKWKKSLFQTVG